MKTEDEIKQWLDQLDHILRSGVCKQGSLSRSRAEGMKAALRCVLHTPPGHGLMDLVRDEIRAE